MPTIGEMVTHTYNGSCACYNCTRIRTDRLRRPQLEQVTREDRVMQQKSERRRGQAHGAPIFWRRDGDR